MSGYWTFSQSWVQKSEKVSIYLKIGLYSNFCRFDILVQSFYFTFPRNVIDVITVIHQLLRFWNIFFTHAILEIKIPHYFLSISLSSDSEYQNFKFDLNGLGF